MNPFGKAYPKAEYGYSVGTIIKNYKFQGYQAPVDLAGEGSAAPSAISLVNFYDPDGENNPPIYLLHLSVAAVWCGPCNQETDDLSSISAAERKVGIVTLQALDDGATLGKAATLDDLHRWIGTHNIKDFNIVLDPGLQNLGQFFNAEAIPWNAYIDVRTMKILYSAVGYNGNVQAEDDKWLNEVGHPANR